MPVTVIILLLLLTPLLLIQLTVQIFALVDLAKRKRVMGGNKWLWATFIVLGALLGAAAYLLIGRKEAGGD